MGSNKKFKIAKDITDKEIVLNLLNSINDKSKITQKFISVQLGIAVGLANSYIKRCMKKGWLKVQNIPPRRYAYYLTPKGFAKKTQLTAEYLTHSFKFFRDSKRICLNLFLECERKGLKNVALVGANDLTEIALLVSRETSINILRVISDDNKKNFFNIKTCKYFNIPKNIDAILLTDINNPEKIYKKIKIANKGIKILVPKSLIISKNLNKK